MWLLGMVIPLVSVKLAGTIRFLQVFRPLSPDRRGCKVRVERPDKVASNAVSLHLELENVISLRARCRHFSKLKPDCIKRGEGLRLMVA
jgi:hypothetical protein